MNDRTVPLLSRKLGELVIDDRACNGNFLLNIVVKEEVVCSWIVESED